MPNSDPTLTLDGFYILKCACFIACNPLKWIYKLLSVPQEKLEDLKRSPDFLNNVKICQGQPQLIMKYILFYHIRGLWPFW